MNQVSNDQRGRCLLTRRVWWRAFTLLSVIGLTLAKTSRILRDAKLRSKGLMILKRSLQISTLGVACLLLGSCAPSGGRLEIATVSRREAYECVSTFINLLKEDGSPNASGHDDRLPVSLDFARDLKRQLAVGTKGATRRRDLVRWGWMDWPRLCQYLASSSELDRFDILKGNVAIVTLKHPSMRPEASERGENKITFRLIRNGHGKWVIHGVFCRLLPAK